MDRPATSVDCSRCRPGAEAQHGIGENFVADAHTGTANASVPLDLPRGRNGLTPDLRLAYSSGEGNGPFGVGWRLSVPAVARATRRGVPRYRNEDVFVLSGYEDLVPVETPGPGRTRHRPRTEGLFALIDRVRDADGDRLGGPHPRRAGAHLRDRAARRGAAGLERPRRRAQARRVCRPGLLLVLTETRDPFGNVVTYEYAADPGPDPARPWNQRYLTRVRYGDRRDDAGQLRFAFEVGLVYDGEPSPVDGRARRRGRIPSRRTAPASRSAPGGGANRSWSRSRHRAPGDARYRFGYGDATGRSLLDQVEVVRVRRGRGPGQRAPAAPVRLHAVRARVAEGVAGHRRRAAGRSMADPDQELVDLTGDGLPDVVRLDGVASRWWRNLGEDGSTARARWRASRPTSRSPTRVSSCSTPTATGAPSCSWTSTAPCGFVRLRHDAAFDGRSFRLYRHRPAVALDEPLVRLIDLDGDGVSDAVRSGDGWSATSAPRTAGRPSGCGGSAATRSRASEALVRRPARAPGRHDRRRPTGRRPRSTGRVVYWPNAGHGAFAARVEMASSPVLPDRYEPARLLLGDVDGDGCADLLYVGAEEVTLWLNRGGESWAAPVTIDGTPRATDDGTVRLVDMHGSGTAGVLWSGPAMDGRGGMCFLDLTGAVKPYLLDAIDNRLGAVTLIGYAPSTRFAAADAARAATRWRTTLPFPVQVVERVERVDAISRTTLTTAYSYRHGYWDGHEREFRGFGRVDVVDTLAVEDEDAPERHSPPSLTRTWYHLGPVETADGGFAPLSLEHEYWPGDGAHPAPDAATDALFGSASRALRRDALRALRGSVLRTEVYAAGDMDAGPFSVVENAYGVREESPPPAPGPDRRRVFLPYGRSHRTTQWERGDDPMTRVVVTAEPDAWGMPLARTEVGLPRRSLRRRVGIDETRVLAVHDRTGYAAPDDWLHIRDRVAQARAFALADPPAVAETDPADASAVVADHLREAHAIHAALDAVLGGWTADDEVPAAVVLMRHEQNRYDGEAFEGRPPGEVGPYGALTRTDRLAFGEAELDAAYGAWRPDYLGGTRASPAGVPAPALGDLGYERRTRSAAGDHDGWYVTPVSRRRDVHDPAAADPRGLVTVERDLAGRETTIVHDPYGLFPSPSPTPPASRRAL